MKDVGPLFCSSLQQAAWLYGAGGVFFTHDSQTIHTTTVIIQILSYL